MDRSVGFRAVRVLRVAAVVALLGFLAFAASDRTFREMTFDAKSSRTYEAGQHVAMRSGLTVTIPGGYTGWYQDYYRIPVWLPLGQSASGDTQSEALTIKPVGAADGDPAAAVLMSFYGPGRVKRLGMTGGSVVASATAVKAFALGPQRRWFRIEIALPGRDAAVVFGNADETVTAAVVRERWRYLALRGVDEPR